MNNFYFGFKGNVFSKMFMMFAVFMAMSGGLYGAAPALSYETNSSDDDGTVDYIQVTIGTSNADFNKSDSEDFKTMFRIIGGGNTITGLYEYTGGSFVEIDSNKTINSGGKFYLKLGSEIANDTAIRYRVQYVGLYDPSMISNGTLATEVSKTPQYTKDKVKPILKTIVGNSYHANDDNITLTFSENIAKITGITDNNITFKQGSIDLNYSENAIVIKDKTITIQLNGGIDTGSYLTSGVIEVTIADNTIKDTASSGANKLDSKVLISSSVSPENYPPEIMDTGSKIDLNGTHGGNGYIAFKVNEKLKNTDDVRINIIVGSTTYPLAAKATYDSNNDKFTINYKDIDIKTIARLVASNTSAGNIELSFANNPDTPTDALGHAMKTNAVAIAEFTPSTKAPTINSTLLYTYPIHPATQDVITVGFSEILKLNTPVENGIELRYEDNDSIIAVSRVVEASSGKAYKFTTTSRLANNKNVYVRTNTDYQTGEIESASEKNLVAHTDKTKKILIKNHTEKPTYSGFILNMKEGNLTIGYTLQDSVTLYESSISEIDYSKIAIVSGTEEINLSNSAHSAALVDGDKNLTIALGSDKTKVSLFLKNATTAKLKIGAINLKTNYGQSAVATITDIDLIRGGFTVDNTKPKILGWVLDFDVEEMVVLFDMPIAFTGSLHNNFAIASGNSSVVGKTGTDTIGAFNTVDVGTGYGKTTVRFQAGDNNKTLIFDLNKSFINEILIDTNLSTSRDNAYLTIRSSSITNISKASGSGIDVTSSANNDLQLTTGGFTATNGNAYIMFSLDKGVKLVGNISVEKRNYKLPTGKWYHRSIPNGVWTTATNLDKAGFDINNMWRYDGGWKIAGGILRATDDRGYWFKTSTAPVDDAKNNRVLATLTGTKETKDELKARIKRAGTTYTLIGITHDLTAGEVTDLKADYPAKKKIYFIHHYDINSTGDGQWNRRKTLNEGEAIWVRQKSL